MKLLEFPDALILRRVHGFFDDFEWYISPHRWTSLSADAGVTAPVEASTTTAIGGVLTMSTGATDNNEVAFATTNKVFLLANEKPLIFETCIQFTEANTDDANVCVGFSSVMNTANMLADDGAGPVTTFDGAVIYKVDSGANGTKWQFCTSLGTAQTITTSQHTAGGSSFQTLRIEIRQGSSGSSGLEAVPFLGAGKPGAVTSWTQFLDANGKPIKHGLGYTSGVAMQAGNYLKAGGANSETLLTDYIAAYQLR